jgi:electron transfer flavoprotein alpha/beta subunit
LKIAVCVKQVPDSAAKLVAVDGKANWGDSPLVINPWDEYAVGLLYSKLRRMMAASPL